MRCILACDIGGTSLKGALIDEQGNAIAWEVVRQTPPAPDPRGWSEKDPEDWWRDFLQVSGSLLIRPEAASAEISGISISGVTRTQVFLDRSGGSIRPAITWADGRAAEQASRLASAQAGLGRDAKTFGPMNAYHTLSRILWVKEEEPRCFERMSVVLEPKDYLNFRLTGEPAGDVISLSRVLKLSDRSLSRKLMEIMDLPPEILPVLREPQDQLGTVRQGIEHPLERLAGLPVFVGGMDAWCGALGIGAIQEGCAFNVSGTSEVFGVVTTSPDEVAGLVTLPWGGKLYQVGGPSQAGADCLAWYIEAFENKGTGLSPADLLRELPGSMRQKEPLLFLPYLRGERTPLWDPDVRGVFLGINRRHSRADFLWAILEGVAFSNRQVLEMVTAEEAGTVQEVRITGGAAASDIWCRTKADVLNLPMVRTRAHEAGLIGAAMVAFTGLGDHANLKECQETLVRVDRIFEPRRERKAFYDQLFKRWIEAQHVLSPLSRAMTRDVREGWDTHRSTKEGRNNERTV